VLDADIKACFDGINHKWLIKNIPTDKTVLSKWLTAGFIDKDKLFPTTAGTPQGGIISPILANMTLDGLESAIKDSLPRRKKVNVIRYVDDFVVTAKSKELLTEKIIPAIKTFLLPGGLELSEEKTRIVHISDGFDFLGMNIRKYGDKLLIKPTKKSILSLIDKVRTVCRKMRGVNAEVLIRKLNPIIRGWVNYYRHVVSKKVFGYIDYIIFNIIDSWLNYRHPNKSWKWIRWKYFSLVKQRSQFSTMYRDNNGKKKVLSLIIAGSTRIVRHVKIRGKANPYDEDYSEYFRKRQMMLMLSRSNITIGEQIF
jgi:RNA-directed DNA polymerase